MFAISPLVATLLSATLALAAPPMPLAGSVGSAVLQPNGSPLQMSDRLSVSGLDYSDWADKMVAEGKLFEPSTDKNFTFRIAAASWTLTSLKCGYLASSEQRMNEVAYSGCEFMRLESKFALRFASLITIEEFCAGAVDDTCINNIDAAFTTVGAFVDASFDVFCHDMFLKIFDECPGGVGGSAALSLTADDGTVHKGSLLALNFENDPGATCPANPLEESVCKLQSAG